MSKIIHLNSWRTRTANYNAVQLAERETREILKMVRSVRASGYSELALRRFIKQLDAFFRQQRSQDVCFAAMLPELDETDGS